MKRATALLLTTLVCLSATATAQTRRSSTANRQSAAAAKTAAARRAAAEKIVSHITTLSNFLYVYGSVVKGIQTSEERGKNRALPPETQALIDKNKSGIVESIRNVADSLRRTEMDFAEDPALKDYYQNVNQLSQEAGQAADAAADGKFDDAGKLLLTVIEALSRALLPPAAS